MQEVFEKIIEKLEALNIENQSCRNCLYREECDAMQEKNDIADNVCLCTMLMKLKAIEIVKQEATDYEDCYKDCGECEAYDKEKHHCPKFCKVITEAVKEIEENHNIQGKWEMTYKGMIKDANTGLMIAAYNCKCSVCGWETGNQGTRFSYCPNCGAKMGKVIQPNGENDENS